MKRTLHNDMILSTLSISSRGFALGFPKTPHTNGDSIRSRDFTRNVPFLSPTKITPNVNQTCNQSLMHYHYVTDPLFKLGLGLLH